MVYNEPVGQYESGTTCCNAAHPNGWSHWFHILPFIEQNNVYNLAKFDLPPIHSGRPTNYNGEDSVARALISTYYCPTRRAPIGYGAALLGRCDYAGSAGFYQGEVHENWGDIPAAPLWDWRHAAMNAHPRTLEILRAEKDTSLGRHKVRDVDLGKSPMNIQQHHGGRKVLLPRVAKVRMVETTNAGTTPAGMNA